MSIASLRRALAAGVAFALSPAFTLATRPAGLPLHQARVRPATLAPYRATPSGPHTFYGTIVAMRGSRLIVRLRSGRTLSVDDARAVAANDYSAPLYLGKLIAVDGTSVGGVFSAQHIYRLSNLQGLQNDR